MAKDSPPSFQFYPHDFVADPAVRLMSPEARGGYIMLLCAAWWQPEPGVVPAEHARALSEIPPDRWPAVEVEIARAFDTTSRPGFWIQRRMISERKAQLARHKNASKGARVTNAARWGSVANDSLDGRCQRQLGESLRVSPSSSSSSSTTESKPKDLSTGVDESGPKKLTVAQDWMLAFDEFWDEYPARGNPPAKGGKAEARKAWAKIRPSKESAAAIWKALDAHKLGWPDPQFIPLAATWLNKGRWQDAL